MNDLISRKAAIKAVENLKDFYNGFSDTYNKSCIIQMLEEIPAVKPEVNEISYSDCAFAMLMMWMNKILTDGEYNKIMEKLNNYRRG